MTDKRAAIELIERMPEQASLDDIMAELHFRWSRAVLARRRRRDVRR
jgi:hypothetical protein